MVMRRIGCFELCFEAGGKLEQLSWNDDDSLLHEGTYELELTPDRRFRVAGWDECFPTIEPHSGSPVMGELIGSAPVIVESPTALQQVWETRQCIASRRFGVDADGRLIVNFRAENRSSEPCKFLWASHALFSTAGLQFARLPDGGLLTEFTPNGTYSKTFVRADGPVELVRDHSRVTLATDQPWWGLWVNRGGWPASKPAGLSILGIEATNTASDSPVDAVLPASGVFSSTVTVEVRNRSA